MNKKNYVKKEKMLWIGVDYNFINNVSDNTWKFI